MRDQPGWLTEIEWFLSAVFTVLAIMVVFWGLAATWGTITTPRDFQSSLSAADRIGEILTWAIVGPILLVFWLPLYFLAGLLGFRLLVPTFAGVPARLVGVICTTWAIGLGAVYAYPDPLGKVLITSIGVAWGLLMPLPRKTLLDYGPVIGGLFIGLGFIALSWWFPGNLTCAVVWTGWRLYKRHAEEVVVTAMGAASLPGLVAVRDLSSVTHGPAVVFATMQVVLLLAIAIAAAFMSIFQQPAIAPTPEPQTPEPQAATAPAQQLRPGAPEPVAAPRPRTRRSRERAKAQPDSPTPPDRGTQPDSPTPPDRGTQPDRRG
jgi:hypothetical protein